MQKAMSISQFFRGRLPALAVIVLAVTLPGGAWSADSYFFDKTHTEIRFIYSHGGVSNQSGEFTKFDGDVILDEEDPSKSSVTVEIDPNSISTGVTRLDALLKNPYYFWIKDHPKVTFESTSVRKVGSRNALVDGLLTIRGISKPVTLDVELVYRGAHPMGQYQSFYKGEWLGIRATTSILRSEFEMESSIPIISDRVAIEIVAELKKRKKK